MLKLASVRKICYTLTSGGFVIWPYFEAAEDFVLVRIASNEYFYLSNCDVKFQHEFSRLFFYVNIDFLFILIRLCYFQYCQVLRNSAG